MFLDPVKVTILTPGMDEQGNMMMKGSRRAGGEVP
jgi:arginine/lysine/ornithine decarboxylase